MDDSRCDGTYKYILDPGPHLCFVLEQAGEVGGHGEHDDEDAGGQGHAAGEVLLGPGQQGVSLVWTLEIW